MNVAQGELNGMRVGRWTLKYNRGRYGCPVTAPMTSDEPPCHSHCDILDRLEKSFIRILWSDFEISVQALIGISFGHRNG
jgi:hypothetical protein